MPLLECYPVSHCPACAHALTVGPVSGRTNECVFRLPKSMMSSGAAWDLVRMVVTMEISLGRVYGADNDEDFVISVRLC